MIWPVVYVPEPPTDVDEEVRERAEAMAALFLWQWTGQQFGLTQLVIRPCRKDCNSFRTWDGHRGSPVGVPQVVLARGGVEVVEPKSGEYLVRNTALTPVWADYWCGDCQGSSCRCDESSRSMRMTGPVHSIEEVLIDGEVLPPSAYRVDNNVFLVRTDGGVWPRCQNLEVAATEPDTFQVAYTYGWEVPEGGQVAAGILAAEMIKAMTSDNSCKLPQRVQTVTRQGVSVTMLDGFEDVDQGRTGLWLVDSWVASVTKPKTGGSVRSPDVDQYKSRRVTWPTP